MRQRRCSSPRSTGTPLNIPSQPIDSFGVADLTGLNFPSAPLPQFIVTLAGDTTPPASVTLKLTWTASDLPDCSTGPQNNQHPGYWLVASDGGIFNYGNAGFYGSAGNIHLNQPIVGMSLAPGNLGYWLVASDGGIFAYGSAPFYGSMGKKHLNKPIVGMASTPDGKGYWLVASDGGIFAFGDAGFYGSAGNIPLNKPIVGMASTPDGGGYWLVASDGGVFNYGDAGFYGSAGGVHLNKPIVGIAANPLGGGYWMAASDGGIFNYGSAQFYGSAGSISLNKPVVGISATFDGKGYWMVASDGGIFNYGDAVFVGSAGAIPLNKPIVGMGSQRGIREGARRPPRIRPAPASSGVLALAFGHSRRRHREQTLDDVPRQSVRLGQGNRRPRRGVGEHQQLHRRLRGLPVARAGRAHPPARDRHGCDGGRLGRPHRPGEEQGGGASIRMWADYFPRAHIFGIDVNPAPHLDTDRITTFVADQGDTDQLHQVVEAAGPQPFDVIVDDGSHFHNHQQISLGYLFKYLKPGGLYFIEDISLTNDSRRVLREFNRSGQFAKPNFIGDDTELAESIDWMHFHAPAIEAVVKVRRNLRQPIRKFIRYRPDSDRMCVIRKHD